MLVYFIFSFFPPSIYLLSSAAVFLLAWWASERAEVLFSQRDCPKIVIDEIAGYLIAMALLPRTLTTVIGGFLFFRIFDIMKTPPAGFVERRLSGGLAVVLDDAVAGIYANFLLHAIIHWHPHFLFIVDRWSFGPI
jgi:phosphatidylglycerophosphatase A